MSRKKSLIAALGVAFVAALTVPIVVVASPASATTSCQTSIYPKAPGAQSGLKIACLIDPSGVPNFAVTGVTWSAGAGGTVYTTSASHGYSPGTVVKVSGLAPSAYNGTFAIVGTPSATQFTRTIGTDPGTCSDCSGTVSDELAYSRIDVHDAANAVWRRGAARTVTITTTNTSATITFASGTLRNTDVRRPISGTGIKGGTFIKSVAPASCTTACTSATMSQTAKASGTSARLIEHTSARYLADVSCTTGGVMTSASAAFVMGDVGKSVSGGPFDVGARISAFTNGTTVTVTPAPSVACTSPDKITIGGSRYTAVHPSTATTFDPEASTRQLAKTTGYTAAASGGFCKITLTAAGGTWKSEDVLLKVQFKTGTGGTTNSGSAGKITSISGSVATTSLTTCPTNTGVVIGELSASAPKNGQTMTTLGSMLNLNPTLVPSEGDCASGTADSFMIVGGWQNPGSYTSGGAPAVSYGQISFPTSVVSFVSYVIPKPAGDSLQASPHYDIFFPNLATSSSLCPESPTALSLGFIPSTLAVPPYLDGFGGGNPTAPELRGLTPATGTFGQTIVLSNVSGSLTTVVDTLTPTGCTIVTPVLYDYSCGFG